MKTYRPLIALLTLCILSAGCARSLIEEPQPEPGPEPHMEISPEALQTEAERSLPKPRPTNRPFKVETLYALLAAELAGSRERFDIALANYVQQAHVTRDPQIAARATHIARFLDAEQEALDAALLWVDIAPDDAEAQLNAAVALVKNGRLQEAFELARELQEQGAYTLFQNIAASAADSTDIQRQKLLDSFRALLEDYPENQQLLVGTGLLLHQEGSPLEALDYARRALELNPASTGGAILEATLLHQLGRTREAIQRIELSIKHQPESLRLRLQYARLLTQTNLTKAQAQFEQLVRQAPQDNDLKLSLAIVAFERGDNTTAHQHFEELLDTGQHLSQSHYYLGQLAERENKAEQAILHYLQVQPGSDFLSATLALLDIFISQGDLESADEHMHRLRNRFPEQAEGLYLLQARTLLRNRHPDQAQAILDQALEEYPTNSDLLYGRAMLYDQKGDLEKTESDLRTLLVYDPNNATALNALGYILADNNRRLAEAERLISKALALTPDDPAIMDSMGWVLYRQGKPEEALDYLERAMNAHPDQEIAAHLGEVLWVLGEEDRARDVWRRGLKNEPDSKLISATKRRLKVDE